jgi:hypothetical protein
VYELIEEFREFDRGSGGIRGIGRKQKKPRLKLFFQTRELDGRLKLLFQTRELDVENKYEST